MFETSESEYRNEYRNGTDLNIETERNGCESENRN